jgi:hypothetical protein
MTHSMLLFWCSCVLQDLGLGGGRATGLVFGETAVPFRSVPTVCMHIAYQQQSTLTITHTEYPAHGSGCMYLAVVPCIVPLQLCLPRLGLPRAMSCHAMLCVVSSHAAKPCCAMLCCVL